MKKFKNSFIMAVLKKLNTRTRLILSFSFVNSAVLVIGLTGYIGINANIILVLTVITIVISFLLCFAAIKSVTNPLSEIKKEITGEIKSDICKMELNPVKYELSDLIKNTVQLNAAKIKSKPVKITIDVKENLPSKLFGDEQHIKQLLSCLLSIAIKHTKEGQVSLSVRYIIADENIMLKFIVKNTGQGIKNEDIKKLFSDGNDLNMAKRIVEMTDGTITVESQYGIGSVFTATVWQTIGDEYTPIGRDAAESLNNFSM